ncbi:hypothetical protein G8V03_09680 [Clostridium botulinum D/C]|uniref:hypothetical protein n=1 Tax=Clostridium botulinum TaxID=1491 RepID=UPI001E3F0EB5|nr:hypothetical protein [Clostridium botulinum]MCD3351256.1 hypothetical protein [Clostridium botulinum D/C]MCD3360213.1 hypothetical protein [Clostridium botulinum D/C]MCD3361684.1 hypothetical protein [Clostridium botulinum D/C]MCD3366018.1 hypothetical protein [Clostridium botulinum D/C]
MIRRLIYLEDQETKLGEIIGTHIYDASTEMNVKYLDLDYKTDKDKFDRAKKFHIEDNKVIFDELYDINKDILKEKDKLKKELLDAQEILVNQKYKEIVGGNL